MTSLRSLHHFFLLFPFLTRCEVKPYYSSPYRCWKCQAYGHLHFQCNQTAQCGNCSQIGHFVAYCANAANCITCRAPHIPDYAPCPICRWQQEIRVKKYMSKTGATYTLMFLVLAVLQLKELVQQVCHQTLSHG